MARTRGVVGRLIEVAYIDDPAAMACGEVSVSHPFDLLVSYRPLGFYIFLRPRDGSAATAAPTEDPHDAQVSWIRLRAALLEGPNCKSRIGANHSCRTFLLCLDFGPLSRGADAKPARPYARPFLAAKSAVASQQWPPSAPRGPRPGPRRNKNN